MEKNLAKARAKDSLRAFSKLTTIVDGEPRIVSDPPLIVPIEDLAGGQDIEEFARGVLRGYRRTLQGDRKRLLERFRYVHAARKVVGVGSVGTRAWIILLLGRDNDDPLFLQLKQAEASVLEPFLGKSKYANHGQRVVEGQRLMQAASDIMLGWDRITGPDGVKLDFYMRQLWDNKGSVIIEGMKPQRAGRVRRDLRPNTGARACALRRRGHDRRIPRLRRRSRQGAGRLRRALRRPERTRLRRAERRRQDRPHQRRERAIARTNWLDGRHPRGISRQVAVGDRLSPLPHKAMTTTQEHTTLTVHDPPRAQHMLMLEFGDRKDFDDPQLEYRRLFSELLGTFMLVLVAAGGGILHGKGQISLAAAVVAPGLMVLAIILFMGAVSGAHLNPAVSLAFAVRGDFPWKRVPGLHHRAAARRDAGVPVPVGGVRQRRAPRRDPARSRLPRTGRRC